MAPVGPSFCPFATGESYSRKNVLLRGKEEEEARGALRANFQESQQHRAYRSSHPSHGQKMRISFGGANPSQSPRQPEADLIASRS